MITKNGDYQIMDPASKSLDQDRNGDDHSEMVMIKAMLAIIRTWITKRESVMITEESDSDDQKSIVMITEESGPMVMISEDRVQRAPAYLEPACVATTTLTTTPGIIIIISIIIVIVIVVIVIIIITISIFIITFPHHHLIIFLTAR